MIWVYLKRKRTENFIHYNWEIVGPGWIAHDMANAFILRVEKLISLNSLGLVKIVQVNFGTFYAYEVNNRFFNPNLAGGALLDIGDYAVWV